MQVLESFHGSPAATEIGGSSPAAPGNVEQVAAAVPDATGPVAHAAVLTASSAAAALLAACGGGGGGGGDVAGAGVGSSLLAGVSEGASVAAFTSPLAGSAPNISIDIRAHVFAAPSSDEEASRFLQQAQFSASTPEIAAVRAQGYAPWLAAQLDVPSAITGVQWLNSRGYGTADARTTFFDHTYPGDFMLWHQLIKSAGAVRKRMALALSEVFVVSLASLDVEWRSHAIAHFWDLLVAGTRGNFRTLLEDVTLSPAMGLFLDTKGNQKEDNRGRQPDENYAREVMQLFTIGLYQLNPDGTDKRGADGNRLMTYTQTDVSNLARVFTGYDLDYSQSVRTVVPGSTRSVGNTTPVTRRMAFNASRHSTLAASFLGVNVAAGADGATALKTALDALFNHPNVGPFIGKQLIQRLVTSNPSPAYVGRVAAVFDRNSAGVRGDMKAVFAAILLDDEARSPTVATGRGAGKLREPMVRFIQWGRTFGLDSAAGSWKLEHQGNADQLGQSPMRAPSVFNFYRPGYVPPSTAIAAANQVAPEFQVVSETTVSAYLNFMQDRIRNGFNVDSPTVPERTYTAYVRDITASYSAELALVMNPLALVNRLNLLLCAGQLTASTRTLIVSALSATSLTATSTAAAKLDRVCAAVLMVMASSEYLIQK